MNGSDPPDPPVLYSFFFPQACLIFRSIHRHDMTRLQQHVHKCSEATCQQHTFRLLAYQGFIFDSPDVSSKLIQNTHAENSPNSQVLPGPVSVSSSSSSDSPHARRFWGSAAEFVTRGAPSHQAFDDSNARHVSTPLLPPTFSGASFIRKHGQQVSFPCQRRLGS